MADEEFRRAALNQWFSGAASSVVPWKIWKSVCRKSPTPGGILDVEGHVFLGVAGHADRRSSFVVACVQGWVEILRVDEGVNWVCDWLVRFSEMRKVRGVTVVSSRTGTVAPQVELAGEYRVNVDMLTVARVSAACGRLYDGCVNENVSDRVSVVGNDFFDDAMRAGVRKWVSGGWVWACPDVVDGDVSPLLAAGMAYDGWCRAEEAPGVVPPTVFIPDSDQAGWDDDFKEDVDSWRSVFL